MTNLNITKENSVLQGNELIFSFGLATDLTVFNKYVTNYRYRYVTEDAYCGSDGCYYLDSETSKQYSDYSIIPSAAIKNDGHAELNFVVPHFINDKVMWIQIEAFDDEQGVYDSMPLEFGPIMTYYNEEPKLACTSVAWDHENILITWSIIDMGVLKPKNLDLIDYNSNGWKSYVNNLKVATKTREAYIRIYAGSSLNKQEQVLVTETISMDKWHPMSQLSTYSGKEINSSNNWYIKAEMSFSRIDGEIDFDFIADSSKVYSSNVLLLNSLVPTFQIKRRGIKVHMLENDSTIGTFATGAGMFNHGEEVGVDVSGEIPNLDKSKGHSIALYDTRAEKDHVSNKPSIGFMNDKHETMGYLRYDPNKGGDRGALVSNLPIIANNQEIDDPTITYNMSIGLILGNNEVKTISFNGKLS